MYSEII